MDIEEESQIRSQLKEIFDFCDRDQSGYLSIEELEESAGQYFNQEDMVQLIEILDPNGQGEISFEDFCHGVNTVLHSRDFESETSTDTKQDLQEISTDEVTNSDYVMSDDRAATLSFCSSGADTYYSINDIPYPSCDNENNDCMNVNHEHEECKTWNENGTDNESNKQELQLNPDVSHFRSFQRLSSNALAHKLFRSSSPINPHSGDYDSDISLDQQSLEDDVQNLNEKIDMLQKQVARLKDSQVNNDDKYEKVKQENTSLMTRIHLLEEQLREHDIKTEEQIKEQQQKLKEIMARQEREKNQELEDYLIRIQTLQVEKINMQEEVSCLRNKMEKLKQEKASIKEKLEANIEELEILKKEKKNLEQLSFQERETFTDKQRATDKLLQQLELELQELKTYQKDTECVQRFRSPSMQELPARYLDLEKELRKLREKNKTLRETNEELQAHLLNISFKQGYNLPSESSYSLANELETLTKEQLMKTLRDQEEDNKKLKSYIDGILLNIVENYPQLLEVKSIP